jgi:hypothetical protein
MPSMSQTQMYLASTDFHCVVHVAFVSAAQIWYRKIILSTTQLTDGSRSPCSSGACLWRRSYPRHDVLWKSRES